MPQPRRKNDPDRRMLDVVISTHVGFPEKDMHMLNRRHLDGWIEDLRKGETAVRRLRKRLEALRGDTSRTCPTCGRVVVGRSDAVYCQTRCRIAAHRSARHV